METPCLGWDLGNQLDVVTLVALASIRFARSCSHGEGSTINGVQVTKVEREKTSLHGRQHTGKRLFIQGRSVYLFDLFGITPKRVSPDIPPTRPAPTRAPRSSSRTPSSQSPPSPGAGGGSTAPACSPGTVPCAPALSSFPCAPGHRRRSTCTCLTRAVVSFKRSLFPFGLRSKVPRRHLFSEGTSLVMRKSASKETSRAMGRGDGRGRWQQSQTKVPDAGRFSPPGASGELPRLLCVWELLFGGA